MRRSCGALRVTIDQFEKVAVSGSGKPSKLLVSLADPTLLACFELLTLRASSELSEIWAIAIRKSSGQLWSALALVQAVAALG